MYMLNARLRDDFDRGFRSRPRMYIRKPLFTRHVMTLNLLEGAVLTTLWDEDADLLFSSNLLLRVLPLRQAA